MPQLELELGGVKVPVEPHGEGEFEAMLAQELKPGSLAVSAMVIAGAESDLLAGELDVHDEGPADKAAHAHGWHEYAIWAGAAAAVLAGAPDLWRVACAPPATPDSEVPHESPYGI